MNPMTVVKDQSFMYSSSSQPQFPDSYVDKLLVVAQRRECLFLFVTLRSLLLDQVII